MKLKILKITNLYKKKVAFTNWHVRLVNALALDSPVVIKNQQHVRHIRSNDPHSVIILNNIHDYEPLYNPMSLNRRFNEGSCMNWLEQFYIQLHSYNNKLIPELCTNYVQYPFTSCLHVTCLEAQSFWELLFVVLSSLSLRTWAAPEILACNFPPSLQILHYGCIYFKCLLTLFNAF